MIHFRAYRNSDSPALAALWNRGLPFWGVARPLSTHEFDRHIVGGPVFDRLGLIVAESDERILGFAHAGFGPDEGAAPFNLSYDLGTICMLVVDPEVNNPEVESGLIAAAEAYLLSRGATVLYAGGQGPLDPYYWGVYGGSEFAGVLAAHRPFHRAVIAAGYTAVAGTVSLEADLSSPDPFDPRGVLIKRSTRTDVEEDALPRWWWEALAIGEFRPTSHRLVAKSDGTELAKATTWDMSWLGRVDRTSRLGLVEMHVNAINRRKGYGRHLVQEIIRFARHHQFDAVVVQTGATNQAALALYQATGFQQVEAATTYRKPAQS